MPRLGFRLAFDAAPVRAMGLVCLAACVAVNAAMIRRGMISSLNVICRLPALGVSEKRFYYYAPALGGYVDFLNRAIPPDSVVMIPPVCGPAGFLYLKQATFAQYVLSPREIVAADDITDPEGLRDAIKARHVTHILLGGAVYRMQEWEAPLIAAEAECDRRWAALVRERQLPAHYMPETITALLRDLRIVFRDGSSQQPMDSRASEFSLLGQHLSNANFRKYSGLSDGKACFKISAEYSGDGIPENPEDTWCVRAGAQALAVESISGEVRSSLPASVCLFASIMEGDRRVEFRSPFNAKIGEWERLTLYPNGPGGAPAVTATSVVDAVGMGVMPLQRGFVKVD